MENKRLSLIDIGSNTIRLVIFNITPQFIISELQNVKIPARLVEYLEDDILTEEGIQVLLRVLKSLKEISDSYQPDHSINAATAAIRRSKNREEIFRRVKEEVDLDIRILSEEEEAFYGNSAVRHTFDLGTALTVDIGGGSTELVYFEDNEIREMVSLPFGAVSLADRFFDGKSHRDEDALEETTAYIRSVFENLPWLKKIKQPIIGIGGSARNVGEVYLRATSYPLAGNHGFEMSPDQIDQVLSIFLDSSKEDLLDLDGLSADRADTIVPATLLFKELEKFTKAKSFILSGVGLREGLVFEYLNENASHPFSMEDVPGQMVVRTARKYRVPSVSVNQRVIIASNLVDELIKLDVLSLNEEELQMFYYANVLYFVGSFIEDESSSQHTFYILSNMNLYGFSHKERVALATLAAFKNKSLFKQYMREFEGWFTEEETDKLLKLGSLIRFSEALNDTHINQIEHLDLQRTDKKTYTLHVTYQGDILAEKYRAEKHKNHMERVLDADLLIDFQSLSSL